MRHSALSLSSSLLARIAVGVVSGENDCEMQRRAGCRTGCTMSAHQEESRSGVVVSWLRCAETMTEIEVSEG
jgi:hypothetical protein